VRNSVDILQQLHSLTAEDRTWILEKLPAPAKSLLLATSSDAPAPAPAAPVAPASDSPSLPRTLVATTVAAALREEPAWLAAAVLEGAAESRIAEIVERLPAVLRSDIVSMRRVAATLTPAARQVLIRLLLAKIGEPPPPEPAPSRFHLLFDRLSASRSRKRLTLHL
jgi:hypothetical protein